MSQAVANQQNKPAASRRGAGRQVRLWVRAKFLSFRRYVSKYADLKFNKMSIKPF